ncbi:PLDc N-terminal domain-containing protein [Nostocoides sp. HKS02]|uniref:PLDc N-terminal domain-containing protein n=1 Tax=Nostocoides sp. HKS02 TaxID=1813880 RepID=UPI001E4AA0BC|nr:PLDc N-terminal domain-containing protein [Tetrasphaera sp. HKS02]
MIRLLPWLLTIALTIYAVVDCVQTDDRAVRGLPRVVWVLLILLVPARGVHRVADGRSPAATATRSGWPNSPSRRPAWPRRRPRLPP